MIINLAVVSKSNKKWLVALLALMGQIVCHGFWLQHGVAEEAVRSAVAGLAHPAPRDANERGVREPERPRDFTRTIHHPATTTGSLQWTT